MGESYRFKCIFLSSDHIGHMYIFASMRYSIELSLIMYITPSTAFRFRVFHPSHKYRSRYIILCGHRIFLRWGLCHEVTI